MCYLILDTCDACRNSKLHFIVTSSLFMALVVVLGSIICRQLGSESYIGTYTISIGLTQPSIYYYSLFYLYVQLLYFENVFHNFRKHKGHIISQQYTMLKYTTPGKKTLFRNGDARANGRRHENLYVKSSSQLRGECCTSSS